MPLTAVHAETGVLDVTCDALTDARWADLHRVRPRAPLRCRECGHGLHAKVSRSGLRFFAHDAGAPNCALAGETIAHRLLKMELASAIRDAGWHAELEVPGDGWRADVLATSPDGSHRMAWEAQLAQATIDELTERTTTMASSGVSVCWVTDKDRPFIGHVPSVRIRAGASPTPERDEDGSKEAEEASADTVVVDGLGVFRPDWCRNRAACTIRAQHGLGGDEGPCPGHGRWARPPAALEIASFVGAVLAGSVRLHRSRTGPPRPLGRNEPGEHLWTTRPHYLAEQEEADATARWQVWREHRNRQLAEKRQAQDDHHHAIAALLARQKALTGPAVDIIKRQTGGYVGVRDATPDWAMGVPLFVQDRPQAVISPVAGRVKGAVRERLEGLTIIVASEKERGRLTQVCVPGQPILVVPVEVDAPTVAPAGGVTVQQAVRRMFGGFGF